jgi:hypothetical protein
LLIVRKKIVQISLLTAETKPQGKIRQEKRSEKIYKRHSEILSQNDKNCQFLTKYTAGETNGQHNSFLESDKKINKNDEN